MRLLFNMFIGGLLIINSLVTEGANPSHDGFKDYLLKFVSESRESIGPSFVITATVTITEVDTTCTLVGTKERIGVQSGEYDLGTTVLDGIIIDLRSTGLISNADFELIADKDTFKKNAYVFDKTTEGQLIFLSKKYEYINGGWVEYDDADALFGSYHPKDGELLFPKTNSVALYYDGGARYLVLDRHINRTFHLIFVNEDNNIYGTWRYNDGVLYLRPVSYSDEDHIAPIRILQSKNSSHWWDGIPLLMRFEDSILRDCTEYSDLWDLNMFMSNTFSRVY